MVSSAASSVRLAGGLVVGVVLVGCSTSTGGESAEATAPTDSSPAVMREAFNNADVTFVQGAIPQHHGALAATELVDGRAGDPRVRDLATRIEAAQESEIEAMTGWLQEWGEPLPENAELVDHGPDDMLGGRGLGSTSEEALAALEAADGPDFERLFLQAMIRHHQDAVDMAQAEIVDGSYPDAIALARDIVRSRTASIGEMEGLLAELGG